MQKRAKPSSDIIATAALMGIVCLFFFRLFWPQSSIFLTQDFGRSDVWHFSLPTKLFLGESLKRGTLPLWNDALGGGFPTFAEGQTGVFFLPNLIAFSLLDGWLAYNVVLVLTFISLALGMYLLLRVLSLSPVISALGSATFVFSGLPVAQVPHITLLQGYSLLAWAMVAGILLVRTPTRVRAVFLSFLLSQQILAGFPQATFMTVLLIGAYMIYAWQRAQPHAVRAMVYGICSGILALGMSAVQLIPSYEFLKQSTNPSGFPAQIASYFSFPLSHLKSFLHPFILGNPAVGTYPPFNRFDGSIFWENTLFLGYIPLLLIVFALYSSWQNTGQHRETVRFWTIVATASFFLMLGSHSPLYFVYGVWPFSLFRAPSRFLWTFGIALVVIASFGLRAILARMKRPAAQLIIICLCFVNSASLLWIWWGYHPTVPVQRLMERPTFVDLAQNTFTLAPDASAAHNAMFLRSGWTNMEYYFNLNDSLAPSSNIMWNVPTFSVYAGRFLHRQASVDSLLGAELKLDSTQWVASASSFGDQLLSYFNIGTIISHASLSAQGFEPVAYTDDEPSLTLYQRDNPTRSARMASRPVRIRTVEQARGVLDTPESSHASIVLVEEEIDLPQENIDVSASSIENQVFRHGSYRATVTASTAGILVIPITYYPGWVASVDGVIQDIFPADIRFSGIRLNEGTHTVSLIYKPQSIRIGGAVSMLSHVIGLLVAFLLPLAGADTFQTALARFLRRQDTDHMS